MVIVDDCLCWQGRVSGHLRLVGTLASRRGRTDHGVSQRIAIVVGEQRRTGRRHQRSRRHGRHRVKDVVVDDTGDIEPGKKHAVIGRR